MTKKEILRDFIKSVMLYHVGVSWMVNTYDQYKMKIMVDGAKCSNLLSIDSD